MKKVSLLSFLLAFWMGFGSMWADEPFRKHRYDAFSVTPPKAGSIVMLGNSITDMHPWAEAFRTTDGQPINIVNRGNSGTYSTEQNDNLESYLVNHPSKIFIMIGTNDMATSGGLNFTPEQLLTQGIAALVKGEKAQDVAARLKGIRCGMKPTSCPDQLAKALEACTAH